MIHSTISYKVVLHIRTTLHALYVCVCVCMCVYVCLCVVHVCVRECTIKQLQSIFENKNCTSCISIYSTLDIRVAPM